MITTRILFGALLVLFFPAARAQDPPLVARSGKYEISLRIPPAGLSARQEMEIEIHIADATLPDPLTRYAPVIRAVVQAKIDMPEMPSMPSYQEKAHPEGVPGDYGVHPTFAHGGSYRLRLHVEPPADAGFDVEFPLQVADAPSSAKRALPPRYWIDVATLPKHLKAGEEVKIRFAVRDRQQPKGSIVSAFETVHEAKFHLIVVRADLAHFAHEHPEVQPDGSFLLRYRFSAGGDYRLFADVAPAGAGSQILPSKVSVGGASKERFQIAASARSAVRTAGDLSFTLEGGDAPRPSQKTVTIPVRILDAKSGRPAMDLQTYLGVKGHFLLVHEDGATFVHSHPSDDQQETGVVSFLARFPKPGLYRGWVQVKRNGQIVTADFILQAATGPVAP